jgi:hypothetical protein
VRRERRERRERRKRGSREGIRRGGKERIGRREYTPPASSICFTDTRYQSSGQFFIKCNSENS